MKGVEVWQQLRSLESRDVVVNWFLQLHDMELNARRSKEITSAAKQAREYFSNAHNAAHTVRPLLTFYGVSCLSRALILLLKPSGGEETLTAGHGLETVNWSGAMAGDVAVAMRNVTNLKVRTSAGLFTEFVEQTKNEVCLHINSAGVDWQISYDLPAVGVEISLLDLFARLPDLHADFKSAGGIMACAPVNQLTYTTADGFNAPLHESPAAVTEYFVSKGYTGNLSANAEIFNAHTPLFTHCYVNKMFDQIPRLNLGIPFAAGACFSQLAITYLVGYALGMLVRYFPTHWVSLVQGEKGDIWWPTLNRAQHLVETTFPELVVEFVHNKLKNPPVAS